MKESIPTLRSAEIQDILGRPPHGFLRVGLGFIAGCWLFLIVGSWFVHYPEKVTAEALISTEQAPVCLTSNQSGKLKEVRTRHLQTVEKDSILAILENPANTEEVYRLKRRFSDSALLQPLMLLSHLEWLKEENALGELEPAWFEIRNLALAFGNHLQNDRYEERMGKWKGKRQAAKASISILKKTASTQKEISNLEEIRYQRSESLYKKGVLSAEELQKACQDLLSSRQVQEEINLQIEELRMNDLTLEQTMLEEDVRRSETWNQLCQQYRNAVRNLLTAVAVWEQKYVLKAPVRGVVSCPQDWHPQDAILAGEELFAVVPERTGALIGQLRFSPASPGTVRSGQKVLIRIHGQPYLETGSIPGVIQSTSLLPNAEHLLTARVVFPEGLKTTYGKRLTMKGEWTGTAEILTQDLRLLERIWNPLRYLLKTHDGIDQ